MTDKQIIIDGKKEDCKILFDCFHIDDSEAYRMLREGVKITPENAPFDDFELRLVANEDSPYGFTSICKRNKNSEEWKYSGFGHSGAASIVTALLKALSRKEQECERLKEEVSLLKESNSKLQQIEDVNSLEKCYLQQLDQLKAENKDYKERFDKLYNLSKKIIDEKFKIDCQNTRFKQTLAEISEIAECCQTPGMCKDYCQFYDKCVDGGFPIILQKISEVENAR